MSAPEKDGPAGQQAPARASEGSSGLERDKYGDDQHFEQSLRTLRVLSKDEAATLCGWFRAEIEMRDGRPMVFLREEETGEELTIEEALARWQGLYVVRDDDPECVEEYWAYVLNFQSLLNEIRWRRNPALQPFADALELVIKAEDALHKAQIAIDRVYR